MSYRDIYPPYHACVDCEIRYSPLTMHKVTHKGQVRYRCHECHLKREQAKIVERERALKQEATLKAWYSNRAYSWGGKP